MDFKLFSALVFFITVVFLEFVNSTLSKQNNKRYLNDERLLTPAKYKTSRGENNGKLIGHNRKRPLNKSEVKAAQAELRKLELIKSSNGKSNRIMSHTNQADTKSRKLRQNSGTNKSSGIVGHNNNVNKNNIMGKVTGSTITW